MAGEVGRWGVRCWGAEGMGGLGGLEARGLWGWGCRGAGGLRAAGWLAG